MFPSSLSSLHNNITVLTSQAERLYYNCRFNSAYEVCLRWVFFLQINLSWKIILASNNIWKITHFPSLKFINVFITLASCMFIVTMYTIYTYRALKTDPYHFPTLLVHIGCLYELGKKNDLFILGHKVAASADFFAWRYILDRLLSCIVL